MDPTWDGINLKNWTLLNWIDFDFNVNLDSYLVIRLAWFDWFQIKTNLSPPPTVNFVVAITNSSLLTKLSLQIIMWKNWKFWMMEAVSRSLNNWRMIVVVHRFTGMNRQQLSRVHLIFKKLLGQSILSDLQVRCIFCERILMTLLAFDFVN